MTEPGLALTRAVMTALKADAGLAGLVADRVFDIVPAGAPLPYLEFGDTQKVADPAEGLDRSIEIFLTLHAYSRKPGRPEIKRLCGAVEDALAGADLEPALDLRVVLFDHDSTRFLSEPDGLTQHGILTFRALIDQV